MMTIQVGSKLVRSLPEGRTAVVENIGKGQTLTKILDQKNNVVIERLKVIKDAEKVGDKSVIHTDRVISFGDDVVKSAVDRVYKDDVYIGSREMLTYPGRRGKIKIIDVVDTKNDVSLYGTFKTHYGDGLHRLYECMKPHNMFRHMNLYRNRTDLAASPLERRFNNLGLQQPDNKMKLIDKLPVDVENLDNMSIKEMRQALQEHLPADKYTNWPGMSSLDERVTEETTKLFELLA